eukprot:6258800-Pyramimonas_sp.AAC.1
MTQIMLDSARIDILHHDQRIKYLGRKLFPNFHEHELSNGSSAGWAKFNQLRNELTNKRFPLRSRLRLFNGTITPCVMYGCCSWTLHQGHDLRAAEDSGR